MSAPVFEEPLVKEIFAELEARGWEMQRTELKSLQMLISDLAEFYRPDAEGTRVRFAAETNPEFLSVSLWADGHTYAELRHAAPRRVRAFLDIMGIVPARDEWVQWFREMQWGEQERDQD